MKLLSILSPLLTLTTSLTALAEGEHHYITSLQFQGCAGYESIYKLGFRAPTTTNIQSTRLRAAGEAYDGGFVTTYKYSNLTGGSIDIDFIPNLTYSQTRYRYIKIGENY